MGRMYTAVFEGVSVSAAQDLFEITAPATAIVVLHQVTITQDASETSEQLPFTIERASASGSGGSTPTAQLLELGSTAFGGTVEANNTARATSSSVLFRRSENVLNGIDWLFTPEMRPVISPSGILIVGLDAAPGAALTMSGTIVFEEIGT